MRPDDHGAVSTTALAKFASRLVDELRAIELPSDLAGEGDLERRVLIPSAARVAATVPGVRLFVHPFRSTRSCQPDCETAHADRGQIVLGCPRCWHDSKALWSVAAFGSHHTFDLVATDGHARLALEAKLVGAQGGRMPNGEIQRFFGQCTLAASKHAHVIGVLISRGSLKRKHHADTERAEAWFARLGVHLVIREVPGTGQRVSKGGNPKAGRLPAPPTPDGLAGAPGTRPRGAATRPA